MVEKGLPDLRLPKVPTRSSALMGRDSVQPGLRGDIVSPTAPEEPWEGPH